MYAFDDEIGTNITHFAYNFLFKDENVKLLRERGDIAKRIKSLQDLRIEQRQMLLRINKLHNVSESTESLKSAGNAHPSVGDSLLPVPAQSVIRSTLRNDSNRVSNSTAAEPSAKKAKNGHFDSLNEDFIPFSSYYSANSTTRGDGDGNYNEGNKFNNHGNGDSFQTGRLTPSGQNDLAQKSKEALYRRAQENSARRRLVDNPCTFFSQGNVTTTAHVRSHSGSQCRTYFLGLLAFSMQAETVRMDVYV